MKNGKNMLFLFLIGVSLSLCTLKFIPVKAESSLPDLDVFAAMLIDADTGQILYEKNADDAFYASGLSKMMVEYLAFEKLSNGEINLMDDYYPSNYVFSLAQETWSNGVINNSGQSMSPQSIYKYSIDEILSFTAIPGSIDATIFLSEAISDEEYLFVDKMNDKAKEFGITSEFFNTTGLDNNDLYNYLIEYNNSLIEQDPEHSDIVDIESLNLNLDNLNKLTARDSAIIAYHLINDYPEILQYKQTDFARWEKSNSFKKTYNQNAMVYIDGLAETANGYPHEFEGIKGLSTGYTEIDGTIYSSFVGYYEKDNKEFIFVVYDDISENENISHIEAYCDDTGSGHTHIHDISKHKKYYESEKLLSYALGLEKIVINNDNFGDYTDFGSTYDVFKGKSDKVKLEITAPIEFYLKDGEEVSVVAEFEEKLLNDDDKLNGPIEKDVEVGTLTIKINEKNFNTILSGDQKISTKLKTAEDIGRPNIFVLIWINTTELANDFIDWIKYVF